MHSSILPYVEKKIQFSPKKILILGDLILDIYSWGNVNRISPEAPIPVIAVKQDENRLGGSANVANNLAQLHTQAYPISVIGTDKQASTLKDELISANIATQGLFVDPQMKTICKQRVLTQTQQLLRIDRDHIYTIPKDIEEKLCNKIKEEASSAVAIIISDYQFGAITKKIIQTATKAAKDNTIPCICDPGRNALFSRYHGVTTIKPNRLEAQSATGITITNLSSAKQACQSIQEMCQAEFVSLSLDKEGILYYKNETDYQLLPTYTHNIYDVTGAGDMVTSIIACCLGDKQNPKFALQLANIAASLEVLKLGVVPIQWSEIANFIKYDHNYNKLLSLSELKTILSTSSSPIILTSGYFDNISTELLLFLQKLRQFQGTVVLAMNSDISFQEINGEKPSLNEDQRKLLLSSLNSIDHIVSFDETNVANVILEIQPSIVVKGENVRTTMPQIELDAIEKIGGKIEFLPFT